MAVKGIAVAEVINSGQTLEDIELPPPRSKRGGDKESQ